MCVRAKYGFHSCGRNVQRCNWITFEIHRITSSAFIHFEKVTWNMILRYSYVFKSISLREHEEWMSGLSQGSSERAFGLLKRIIIIGIYFFNFLQRSLEVFSIDL